MFNKVLFYTHKATQTHFIMKVRYFIMKKFESYEKIKDVKDGNMYYKIMASYQGIAIKELFEVEREYVHDIIELYGDCISLEKAFEKIAKDFKVDIIIVKYIFRMCTIQHNIDKIEKYFAKPYGNRYKKIQVVKGNFWECLGHSLFENNDKSVKTYYIYEI